jgi:hypothetical protein
VGVEIDSVAEYRHTQTKGYYNNFTPATFLKGLAVVFFVFHCQWRFWKTPQQVCKKAAPITQKLQLLPPHLLL